MDKLTIEGGQPLSGEVRASGAKNAALPILCAALLTPEPLTLDNLPQLNDVRTMRSLLSQMGVALDTRRARHRQPRCVADRLAAGSVRAGEDDARVDPRAGAAPRALRRGARVAARRLRDRPAPGRPARQGPAGDGRHDRSRARLHQCNGSPARRQVRVRRGDGHRHREPADGGHARRRHDGARKCGARAGSRRSRALPHRDGRADHGRRQRPHHDRRRRELHGATHAIMPDRIETGTFPRRRRRDRRQTRPLRAPGPIRSTRCSTSCARRARSSPSTATSSAFIAADRWWR